MASRCPGQGAVRPNSLFLVLSGVENRGWSRHLGPHRRGWFCVDLAKLSGDFLDRSGHLLDGLLESLPEFLLEGLARSLDLPVDPPHATDHPWETLWPEHDQASDQEEDQLTSGEVEHLFSIGCDPYSVGVQQRLPSVLTPPIAFAHRGARSIARENTIEAFILGLRLGANGLETDAWLTADGRVVLDHDGVIRRRGRKTPISQVDSNDLPPHIPTLRQLYDSCGTDYHLSIDVKDPASFDTVVEESFGCGFDLRRLWLCHTDASVLAQWRERDTRPRIVASCRVRSLKMSAESFCARLAEDRIDVLNMPVADWNGGLVTMAHRFGLLAFGWDAQLPRVITDGLRMGLDAVYSDHVDAMVDVYTAEIGHQPRR